jgi:UDPglucose--hexose-1-phosphate uridylyltransferase
MSELRWNPLLGEWVITATHRQDRTFLPPEDFCPLCPTRPGGPPTEIAHADFDIVVFDNRFPSLQPHPPEPAVLGTELMPVRPAMGACEVVVYTPRHDQTLRDASLGRLRKLIAVWAHRTSELGARPEVACVFVFENKGETIGVTLRHPHGQIYAYPWIPPVIAREVASGEAHRFRTGGCLWCDLLAQERADGRTRSISRRDGTSGFCRSWSRPNGTGWRWSSRRSWPSTTGSSTSACRTSWPSTSDLSGPMRRTPTTCTSSSTRRTGPRRS